MQNKIENSVAAIIVTYNGDDALLDNIQALLSQCEKVIIVDNNSTADMSAAFDFAQNNGVEIIRNSENLGVATALNIGVRHALDLGFRYLLTMDQDSVLYDNCVRQMLDVLVSDKKIGSVFPNLRPVKRYRKTKSGFLSQCRCITSGNLIKAEVFEKTGGYEDLLFIDSVDFDFNFRVKLAGYKNLKINNAFMRQKFGSLTIGRFGKKLHGTPSAFRYYYIARNYKYQFRTYFLKFPLATAFLFLHIKWSIFWRIMLFSKDSKAIRKEIKRGKKDYKTLVKQLKEKRKNAQQAAKQRANLKQAE